MTKDELKPIDVSKYRVTETGQVLKMTKDELAKKADTNHALISQLSELEAENAELKEDLRNKKLAIQNRNGRIKELEKDCDETQELLDKQIEATLKLYKENLELKEHHKSVCDTLTNTHRHIREQLNEAKELLMRFVWASAYFNGEEADLIADAKQFLKEV